MNGVPEYHRAKFKQSASGVWSCETFEVVDERAVDVLMIADDAMTKIEEILERHNKKEQPVDVNKWKKAADELIAEKRAKKPPAKEEK